MALLVKLTIWNSKSKAVQSFAMLTSIKASPWTRSRSICRTKPYESYTIALGKTCHGRKIQGWCDLFCRMLIWHCIIHVFALLMFRYKTWFTPNTSVNSWSSATRALASTFDHHLSLSHLFVLFNVLIGIWSFLIHVLLVDYWHGSIVVKKITLVTEVLFWISSNFQNVLV